MFLFCVSYCLFSKRRNIKNAIAFPFLTVIQKSQRSIMSDATSFIFHEKQEGQLCAQHALNNLLQGEFFTPIDLATIARELDEAELEALLSGASTERDKESIRKEFRKNNEESQNYDDSGFFSVQVIQKALQVWNLQILPIGSKDPIGLKAKQTPEDEVAFILNLAEHWFCLRRFGNSVDRWYNLNSVNAEPEHVSKTYLGMLLNQMENEGYSIFVVVGNVAESDADGYCNNVPNPPASALVKKKTATKTSAVKRSNTDDDLKRALRMSLGETLDSDENEDNENDDDLQAALKASMMDEGVDRESLALAISASLQAGPSSSSAKTPPEKRERRGAEIMATRVVAAIKVNGGNSN